METTEEMWMGALLFTPEQGNSAIDCCVFWSDFVSKPDTHFEVISLVKTINMSIFLSTESKQLQQEQSAKQTKRKSDKVEMGPRKIEFREATNSETSRESIQEV